ncbi:MAG: cysteine protease StiP family protein [Selenomonadaceae bacterium]|nr:cysteine protease StiP family protein [Selenomonadaceae bacterium]
MFGTYRKEDVIILLKDITGLVQPQNTEERERLIQAGRHYSEMLPIEYEPSEKYMKAYYEALARFAKITAEAVAGVCDKIYSSKGDNITLVSLARAGTSIGVLIKRYLEKFYGIKPCHYTISIIRGRGIDKNAVNYILSRHKRESIQFVDGWIGKGAIQRELTSAMKDYPRVNDKLAVLSDPAYITDIYGTREDFLIASSCLNSTVSGLLSRTFYRKDIIGENDFHGAAFYSELASKDLTYQFIDAIEKEFLSSPLPPSKRGAYGNAPLLCGAVGAVNGEVSANNTGMEEVLKIAADFGIADINLIKPGIGEATRVLLRRMPRKLLVYSLNDYERLGHLYELAAEKGVEVEKYPLKNYLACGLIQSLADN